MDIYDSTGKVMASGPPRVLSGDFCRRAYFKGNVAHKNEAEAKLDIAPGLVRYQVPWLVSLLHYDSPLQMEPQRLEMHIYAPPKESVAAKAAYELWRWWWKDVPTHGATVEQELAAPEYPKIEDGMVAEVTDDATFMDAWKFASRKGPAKRMEIGGIRRFTPGYLAGGHPMDPWCFIDMSGDVRIFKSTDFQSGLQLKL